MKILKEFINKFETQIISTLGVIGVLFSLFLSFYTKNVSVVECIVLLGIDVLLLTVTIILFVRYRLRKI